MAPYFNNSADDRKIRMIAALCYMTMGVAGLIYILFNAKNNQSMFLRFHFMQSLLLGIIVTLISWLSSGLGQFLSGLLGLFGSAGAGVAGPFFMIMSFVLQAVQIVYLGTCIWGVVQSARGKYVDMPVVGKIVRSNLR
ncbi:MAG: hypothetical protein JSS83_15950 [Cyanobacteria bacterium SZAS LIN-3]|nr:hypothetical protein [Cyanobacteria bacterium SZAS LIN-3]MBS2009946.1 hypothetical protein [Cyanobacteria bacterium SZAS TMP-1]